jgi:hypothetical protein
MTAYFPSVVSGCSVRLQTISVSEQQWIRKGRRYCGSPNFISEKGAAAIVQEKLELISAGCFVVLAEATKFQQLIDY